MERIDIICIGTIKEKYLREMIAEYEKRLSRFCKLNIVQLSEKKLSDSPSDAEIQKALEAEGEMMVKNSPADSFKIALCIEGGQMPSEKFASKLQNGFAKSGKIAFFIGSSYGMSEKLKNICDLKFSMSSLTFPHQIARCMLLEQIYRTYKIRNNETYHK